MKKLTFAVITDKLRVLVARFIFPVVFICGLAVLFFVEINQRNAHIQERMWAFFATGIPLTLMVSLFAENFKNLLFRYGLLLLTVGLLLLHTLLLPEKLQTVHIFQFIAIGSSTAIACFAISFYRKNDAVAFWEFSKTSVVQLIISLIFSQVLMMGLSLAVLSLDELFNINVKDDVYQNLAVVCFGLFLPLYFLANIPEGDDKLKTEFRIDKFIKILGLYIILPILIIYTVILYVYLLQIIVKWELPNGWVSWLVTVLALAGFVSLMLQYPLRVEKHKVAVFFARFFPLILLPLLVLMSVGIFRRISDYGITINRAYVLIFNLWLYGISIYLLITGSKYLKYIINSFAIVTVLSSIGPWSVFEVTRRALLNDTEQMLTSLNYLENGKVKDIQQIKSLSVDENMAELLQEKVRYLTLNYGSISLQSFFNQEIASLSYWEISKLLNIETSNNFLSGDRHYYFRLKENNQSIDIREYSKMIRLKTELYNSENSNENVSLNRKENILSIKDADNKYNIQLESTLKELIKQGENEDLSAQQLMVKSENCILLIEYTYLIIENSKPRINELQGWVFLK